VHKILIVHDDKAMCDLLRACLSEGYEAINTVDPEQALGLALQHKPDAIPLGLMMPKFSGFELCQSFRSLSYTCTIPILVITGPATRHRSRLLTGSRFQSVGLGAMFHEGCHCAN
jgi:DNA-binding response OmpR family regulator